MKEQDTKLAQIFIQIPKIMSEVNAIGKNQKNKSQGYSFRGIDDMYNELHSLFAKHKVFYTSSVLDQKREERPTKSGGLMISTIITVEFTFYAEDGSNVKSVMIGEGSDTGDKSANKAMSTALKYALMQLLLIPTKEEKDTEHRSPEYVQRQAPPKKTSTIDKLKEAIKKPDMPDTVKSIYTHLIDSGDEALISSTLAKLRAKEEPQAVLDSLTPNF